MKKCTKCKKKKPIDDFPKDKQNPKGIKVYCRVCSSKLAAKYYKKNKHKRLSGMSRYYNKIKNTSDFKLKSSARTMVAELVRKGLIERLPCCFCGESKVQAHHYNGYENENAIKIIWVCKIHHEKLHHPSPIK